MDEFIELVPVSRNNVKNAPSSCRSNESILPYFESTVWCFDTSMPFDPAPVTSVAIDAVPRSSSVGDTAGRNCRTTSSARSSRRSSRRRASRTNWTLCTSCRATRPTIWRRTSTRSYSGCSSSGRRLAARPTGWPFTDGGWGVGGRGARRRCGMGYSSPSKKSMAAAASDRDGQRWSGHMLIFTGTLFSVRTVVLQRVL